MGLLKVQPARLPKILLEGLGQLWWLSQSDLATRVYQLWWLTTTWRAVGGDYLGLKLGEGSLRSEILLGGPGQLWWLSQSILTTRMSWLWGPAIA